MTIFVGYLFGLPILPSAYAAGTIEVMGAGAKSCGSWVSDRSNNAAWTDGSWVLGYVTAEEEDSSMAETGSVSVNTDADGLFGWLDDYCRANPTESIHQAAAALIQAVHPFIRDTQ
jgi:hypothetical protein